MEHTIMENVLNQNAKKVSVIIPCYNAEKWIDRCVSSLVGQTIGLEALELIFVDDASTDHTFQHLEKWEEKYPESIVVISCKENGRQGAARNIGFTYTSAPYIGYVDADDWLEKNAYEILYGLAVQHDTDITMGRVCRDTGNGWHKEIEQYIAPMNRKLIIRTKQERHRFLKYQISGFIGNCIYKKSFLLENEIFFPEKLAYEDNYFGILNLYKVSSIYLTDSIVYHYFVNQNSTVSTRNSMHHFDRLAVEEMALNRLREEGCFPEFQEELTAHFLELYYINTLHVIFTRFDILPMDVLAKMKKTVLQQFPEWKKAKSYESLSAIEKDFLVTLEMDMTKEGWEWLKEYYLSLLSQK